MHQKTADSQLKPLRNKACKEKILQSGKYTAKLNSLEDAWFTGEISNDCYKLISMMLRHSEDFQVKDAYLMPRFKNNRYRLSAAKAEAQSRNMLIIHKVRVGRSFQNHYELTDFDLWDLSSDLPSSTVKNSTVEISTVADSTVEFSTPLIILSGNKTNSSKKKNNNNKGKTEKPSTIKLSIETPSQTKRRPKWSRKWIEPFQAILKNDFINYDVLYDMLEKLGSNEACEAKLRLFVGEGYSPDNPIIEAVRRAGREPSDEELCDLMFNHNP